MARWASMSVKRVDLDIYPGCAPNRFPSNLFLWCPSKLPSPYEIVVLLLPSTNPSFCKCVLYQFSNNFQVDTCQRNTNSELQAILHQLLYIWACHAFPACTTTWLFVWNIIINFLLSINWTLHSSTSSLLELESSSIHRTISSASFTSDLIQGGIKWYDFFLVIIGSCSSSSTFLVELED